MAETYLITAKTVAEAIAVAKREYEDADHEISYEIVRMEKKGLFGLLGAKDAQIKVTVSKVVSVQSELGSLVADIKNLKSVTDRGSSGAAPAQVPEKPQPQQNQKQPSQKQNQNQKQQKAENAPKQNQSQQKQQNQPKQNQNQQKQQNQPKADNAAKQNQNQQKQQNQPKAEPKADNAAKQNQNQQKQQNQPKADNAPKQNQNQQKQQNQPKAEPKAEPKTEPKAERTPEETSAAAEQQGAAFGAAETPYRSALGNQATPRKRSRQKKAVPHAAEEDLSAAVTVSAPVSLTDFVSEGTGSSFGSASTPSGGRMNNDIRKKNRGQKPAAEAERPAEETPALSTTVVPASEVPSQSRRSRGRRGGRGSAQNQNQRTDAAPRYDIAESEEDYERLDALVAEAEAVFEAKKAEASEAAEPVREERRREAITQAEMDYALAFVNTLLENMRLDARAVPAECPEGEEFDVTEEATVYPKIDIVGDDTGILIGHHGETLDSIQYLANLSALRRTKSRDGDYVKIVVDIENYRQKREDTLRSLARRMAARAVRYRRNVFLEPMNAYERRIIHSELQSYDGVSTHSVGTDRDRKIIVTYEGPDKQPDRRRTEEKPAEPQQNQQAQQGQKKSRSRRGRGGDKTAAAAAEPAVNVGEQPKESGERRRPRKQPKMSIEELTNWLPDAGEATGEVDDTLNVMSGLRAHAAEQKAADESAEAVAEAAAKAEEAVREAEAKFEAKAAALLETLEALADDKGDAE